MNHHRPFILVFVLLLISAAASRAQLTPAEAVPLMQKGINLGNTLEPPLEGGWNNPPAQEYYFDLYKQAGFQTIRVPVRWDMHTQIDSPFTVSTTWMQRVEQIVDWAIERDLFVIINAHHEDWIKQNYTNPVYRARFDSIWSQISVYFRNKTEKLVFEVINEPNGLTKAQNDELHARIISIIRKTNPTRLVIFQGHNWGGSDELIAAAIPDDDYVIGSFHSYDPYLFGLEGQGTWGTTTDYNTLKAKFQSVKTWSEANQISVILGEFGALRTCDYNSRMKHYRAYTDFSHYFGFIYCAWDDGGDFKILDRQNRKWDEVKDIVIHTGTSSPKSLNLNIIQDTIIRVTWANAVTNADSLIVEHRTGTTGWKRLDQLKGDTTLFLHINPAQDMDHYYRVIAQFSVDSNYFSQPVKIFMPLYVPKTRSPYLGMSMAIPGIIEAEDYDGGGEGFTYHDYNQTNLGGVYRMNEGGDIYSRNSDGYQLGSLLDGEWYEYSVTVAQTARYRVGFHLSSFQGGGTLQLSIDTIRSSLINVPKTNSLLITQVVNDTLELTEGNNIMRLTVMDDEPSFNIDKIEFSRIDPFVKNDLNGESPFSLSFTHHVLRIKSSHEPISGIRVIGMSGITVKEFHPNTQYVEFALGDIPKGIYILQIRAGSKNHFSKILVD